VTVNEDEAIDLVLAPGEMSLHHVLIFHGSPPNRASYPRIGFAIRYVPPHVHQLDGTRGSATVVRGEDTTGHREHERPPVSDLYPDAVAHHAAVVDRQLRTVLRGAGGKGKLAATVTSRHPTQRPGTDDPGRPGPRPASPPPLPASPHRPVPAGRARSPSPWRTGSRPPGRPAEQRPLPRARPQGVSEALRLGPAPRPRPASARLGSGWSWPAPRSTCYSPVLPWRARLRAVLSAPRSRRSRRTRCS
jgi:hypothetical protein